MNYNLKIIMLALIIQPTSLSSHNDLQKIDKQLYKATRRNQSDLILSLLKLGANPYQQMYNKDKKMFKMAAAIATSECLDKMLDTEFVLPQNFGEVGFFYWRLLRGEDSKELLLKIAQKMYTQEWLSAIELQMRINLSIGPTPKELRVIQSYLMQHLSKEITDI